MKRESLKLLIAFLFALKMLAKPKVVQFLLNNEFFDRVFRCFAVAISFCAISNQWIVSKLFRLSWKCRGYQRKTCRRLVSWIKHSLLLSSKSKVHGSELHRSTRTKINPFWQNWNWHWVKLFFIKYWNKFKKLQKIIFLQFVQKTRNIWNF